MWSSGVGPTHRAAVKAWKEGREFHRESEKRQYIDVFDRGDGVWVYKLFGHTIAMRLLEQYIPREVAKKLRGEEHLFTEPVFSFADWPTPTTAVHLEALGIDAYNGRKDHPPTFFGREVDPGEWVSIEEVMQRPVWTPPPKKPRAARFENVTLPLFEGAFA